MSLSSNHKQKYYKSLGIEGLYSLQCVSLSSGAPDITIYRRDLNLLIGEDKKAFLRLMVASKRFSYYVLQHSAERFDYYDKKGRLLQPRNDLPEAHKARMVMESLLCDNALLARQSTWLIQNPTVCGSFEAHAGQSASERSNFYTMVDQLLQKAPDDKDREQIYVLSHFQPCPRAVLAADLTQVSPRAQSLFLDYFRRIQKGWPLSDAHHKTELARTFSSCRYAELRQWLRLVRQRRRPEEDLARFEMVLMGIPLGLRFDLARIFIEEVYLRIRLPAGGVEQIEEVVVVELIDEIGARVDRLLATPMSNI